MEYLLLPDTVYILVKTGLFDKAFTVYGTSVSLWV